MITGSGNIQQLFGATAGPRAATALQTSDLRPGESFLDALNRQYGRGNSNATGNGTSQPTTAESAGEAHAKARKAAEGLVSNALILPVLKQLRHDPFGQNTIFSPGTGEKTFGPQFDMQIADRIAQSPRMAATEVLTKRIEARGQGLKSGAKATAHSGSVRAGVNIHG